MGETGLIINSKWKEFVIEIVPTQDVSYLIFEAYYNTPLETVYNGNLIMDNLSAVSEIDTSGSFFPDSLYNIYLPKEEINAGHKKRKKTSNTEKVKGSEGKRRVRYSREGLPSAQIKLISTDLEFYKEQSSYLIFRRGNISMEDESLTALKEIVKRLKENKTLKIIFNLKGDNSLIKNSRRSHIRDFLLEEGLAEDRFLFDIDPQGRAYPFTGGSRDVEVLLY